MEREPLIKFSFEGSLADRNLMDFYEASRFHYGAARLLYTVNYLSEHGKIPKRITKKIYNQAFVIHPPKKGSWELFVLGYIGLKVSDQVIKRGTDYILNNLFPLKKKLDETATLIKRQGHLSENAQNLVNKIQGSKKENQLEIKDEAVAFINQQIIDTKLEDDFRDLVIGLNQAAKRFKSAGIYEAECLPKKLSLEQQYTLIDKTRVMFKEIGYPLNKSADSVSLIHTNDNKEKVTNTIFLSDIDALSENEMEETITVITARIKSFDKETGWLKIRVKGDTDAKGMLLKRSNRKGNIAEVLEAMKNEVVIFSVYRVITPVGSTKYYVFNEYLGTPETKIFPTSQ
ncbi:MAG: hypothetical protein JKY25_08905 [Robiginitomaculum sp.]|nr:hypothetical protein [Robiginitomaculum sp.]